MLDWLIVGGGIHGVHIAHSLIQRNRVQPDRLSILDPHAEPLARWNHCTANVDMNYLRSPRVHHLGLDSEALTDFGRTPYGRVFERYRSPYSRPAYDFFQAHTQQILTESGLRERWLQGKACGLRRLSKGWGVQWEQGETQARRVVLALGRTDLRIPAWARALQALGAAVEHIFAPGFKRAELAAWHHAVVIGGGISAGQTALSLAKRQPGTVTLLTRRPVEEQTFDSDPCWNGPKCLRSFYRCPDYAERRRMIAAGRHPGTMSGDVWSAVRSAVREGSLRLRHGAINQVQTTADSSMALTLDSGDRIFADRLLLATGFESARPGGAWVAHAMEELGLPCAPCGYPIVDARLNWFPGLHVTGPLAELEIGATAPNIRGARAAAERLVGIDDAC